MSAFEELLAKVNEINHKLKRPAIVLGSDYEIGRIPTGSLLLDRALDGGWPRGRMVLLWGNYGSTKSTLALWTIAKAQAMGLTSFYIDTEKTFDGSWAEANGVKTAELPVYPIQRFDELCEVCKSLMDSQKPDVLVIDTITPIYGDKFFEEDNSSTAIHARSVGELLTKLNTWNRHNCLIILISQARVTLQNYKPGQQHTGGQAVDHYTSIILKLFASSSKENFIYEDIKIGDKLIKDQYSGRKIKWEVAKSKVSRPFLTGEYILLSKGGIDSLNELITLSLENGVIEKAGSWYKFGDKQWQGERELKKAISENGLLEEIWTKMKLSGVK